MTSRTGRRHTGWGFAVFAAVVATLTFVATSSAAGAASGKPEKFQEEFVEVYEDPELALACGINTVDVVDFGKLNVKVFPNGQTISHLTERTVLSNPETGDEVYGLQKNLQKDSAEESIEGDILTLTIHLNVSGLGASWLIPGKGVAFTEAGHFEAILTIKLDVSSDPPNFISFDEELVKSAGSIRAEASDEAMTKLCEGLGGSFTAP